MATFADSPTGGKALFEWSLVDSLERLASGGLDSPAGHAAAISAAFAAALTAATARQMNPALAEGAVAQALALRARLYRLAGTTAAVHRRARKLLELAEVGPPRDAESELRNEELASALREAAEAPMRICEAAADVVSLAAWVAVDGPRAARPDATVAAYTAEGAVASAAALVEANLAVRAGDELATQARAHADHSHRTRRSLEARD